METRPHLPAVLPMCSDLHLFTGETGLVPLNVPVSFSDALKCGQAGGPSERRHYRNRDTGKAGVRCASGSDVSTRLPWQTSIRSPASCSGRAFHLVGGRTALSSRLRDYNRKGAVSTSCSLTCVCPHVRCEVVLFCVGLPAAWELAVVCRQNFQDIRPACSLPLHLPGGVLTAEPRRGCCSGVWGEQPRHGRR